MDNIKENLLTMVLESEDVDYLHLDNLVNTLYKDEEYIQMLATYYLSFFLATHQIDVESLLKSFASMNLFEKRKLILDIAEQVSLKEAFCFYEELLIEMNRNYQSNAVKVIEGVLEGSETAIAETLEQIKELSISNLEN